MLTFNFCSLCLSEVCLRGCGCVCVSCFLCAIFNHFYMFNEHCSEYDTIGDTRTDVHKFRCRGIHRIRVCLNLRCHVSFSKYIYKNETLYTNPVETFVPRFFWGFLFPLNFAFLFVDLKWFVAPGLCVLVTTVVLRHVYGMDVYFNIFFSLLDVFTLQLKISTWRFSFH